MSTTTHTALAPSDSTSGGDAGMPFNPALAEGLAAALSESTGDGESVAEAVAAIAADDTVEHPVAPAAPRAPKVHTGKGPQRPVAPNAKKSQKYVEPNMFHEMTNAQFVSVLNLMLELGTRPLLCLDLEVKGEYSSVEFALSLLPGNRVQLIAIGGEGVFAARFAGCTFFRDEIRGEREVPEYRARQTRGLRGLIDLIA